MDHLNQPLIFSDLLVSGWISLGSLGEITQVLGLKPTVDFQQGGGFFLNHRLKKPFMALIYTLVVIVFSSRRFPAGSLENITMVSVKSIPKRLPHQVKVWKILHLFWSDPTNRKKEVVTGFFIIIWWFLFQFSGCANKWCIKLVYWNFKSCLTTERFEITWESKKKLLH